MEERLALPAEDKKELLDKLKEYLKTGGETAGLYLGDARKNSSRNEFLIEGEAGEAFLRIIIKNKEFNKLARLWVDGVDIDWTLLYGDVKPKKISLPTYPFARERHWITENKVVFGGADQSRIHPLLDRVAPELSLEKGISFKKTLKPDDLIVWDYQVKGGPLFPGVGFIEAAWAALNQTVDGNGFELFKAAFPKPLRTEDKAEYLVGLEKEGKKIKYLITGGSDPEKRLCSQGEFRAKKETPAPERISLEELKAGFEKSVEKEPFYKKLKEIGLDCGPSFQTVKKAWFKEGEALGLLELDKEYKNQLTDYRLVPGLLDGALQLGALLNQDSKRLKLPFALEKMKIFSSFKVRLWGYLKETEENKFNLALFTDEGEAVLKIYGFVVREVKKTEIRPDFYYLPRWSEAPALKPEEKFQPAGESVLIVSDSECFGLAESLAALHQPGRITQIKTDQYEPPEELKEIDLVYFLSGLRSGSPEPFQWREAGQNAEDSALDLFRLMKALEKYGFLKKELKLKIITNNVFQITDETIIPESAVLLGLARSLAREYQNLELSYLDLDLSDLNNADPGFQKKLAAAAVAEPFYKELKETAPRNGRRYQRALLPVVLAKETESLFKKKGVYLILGGAGGIGLELARYLSETKKAGLILIGRSPLSPSKEEILDEIRASGSKVVYRQADAADFENLQKAVEAGEKEVGKINGVLHSALVLRDRLFSQMSEEDFKAVLAPKIAGGVNLARALSGRKLDFTLFFSSLQSFLGNAGQSNYAAASTFQDAWAASLAQKLSFPVKVVNWGYWGTVGVVANETYRKLMSERGIYSIEPAEGMEAAEKILSSQVPQVAVVKAEPETLKTMGFDLDKRLEIYPSKIPSLIDRLAEADLPDNENLKKFEKEFRELEALVPALLLETFQKEGIFKQTGERRRIRELRKILKIIPEYRPLYHAMLDILKRASLIEFVGGEEIIVLSGAEELALKKTENIESLFPALKDHFKLLSICLDSCFLMLRGERDHVNVLFPKGSLDLVEKMYRGNASADYFNSLSAGLIADYLEKRLSDDPDAKLNILEVGAGTGSTSRTVLEKLKPFRDKITYCCTDISPRFIQYVQDKFQTDYPFFKTKAFNIERDPEAQGIEAGSVDLVLGVNVVHATASVEKSLSGLKRVLKSGGVLLLGEITGRSDFLTLTFGFTDGWWLFKDTEKRIEHSPLLTPEQWRRLLRENGFLRSCSFGGSAEQSGFKQIILAAESDGLVSASGRTERKSFSRETNRPPKPEMKPRIKNKPLIKAETLKTSISAEQLKEKTIDYLKTVFSRVFRIKENKIKATETFDIYGVDSLMVMEITRELENDFGDLDAALLFENATLESLSDYFMSEHSSALKRLFLFSAPAGNAENLFDDHFSEREQQSQNFLKAMEKANKRKSAQTQKPLKPRRAGFQSALKRVSINAEMFRRAYENESKVCYSGFHVS